MHHRKLWFLSFLSMILLLSASTGSGVSPSWGVTQGDTAFYFLDNVNLVQNGSDSGNLARTQLSLKNRTSTVTITSIGQDFLNYTLGLRNGSELVPNQQIKIEKLNVSNTNIILPTGDLPFVLPLELKDYGDYLFYMSDTAKLFNFTLQSLINSETNISASDLSATLDSTYNDSYLTFKGDIKASNVTDIGNISLSGLNITDQMDEFTIDLNDSQTIQSLHLGTTVLYNSTDGMLQGIDVGLSLTTNTSTSNGYEINTLEIYANLSRQRFIPIDVSQLPTSATEDASGFPFFWVAVIPILYIVKGKRS